MTSTSALYMLRIEVDGHFHGSPDVPKPWAALITGPSPKYGLAREFVKPMNDWRDASKAWSGNTYGVVATFPLRNGNLYEVERLRGKPSKRHVAREYYAIEDGKRVRIHPEDVLRRVAGISDAIALDIDDDRDSPPWVAEVTRVGSTSKQGFVLIDGKRRYLLRPGGLYEISDRRGLRLVHARADAPEELTQREAIQWLASKL